MKKKFTARIGNFFIYEMYLRYEEKIILEWISNEYYIFLNTSWVESISCQISHSLILACMKLLMIILTYLFFSFLINPGDGLEGSSEGSLRRVVCSKPFYNVPVGGVVVDRREFDQCFPELLGYWEVLRRVALELSNLYLIL